MTTAATTIASHSGRPCLPGFFLFQLSREDAAVPLLLPIADSLSGDLDLGALSVSGQRETANAFHFNGSNVQEDVNMGVTIVPTLDSIGELSVLTSSFDAKLGNQSGGQIEVQTRSGSDHLHGSAYDYFRNTALDARNYFSLTRAPFHQNQFGGTLGVPYLLPGSFFSLPTIRALAKAKASTPDSSQFRAPPTAPGTLPIRPLP